MRGKKALLSLLSEEAALIKRILILGALGLAMMLFWSVYQKVAASHAAVPENVDGYYEDYEEDIYGNPITKVEKKRNPYLSLAVITTVAFIGFAGYFVVGYLLPNMAQRATDFAYGSGEKVDIEEGGVEIQDLLEAEDWEGALAGYKELVSTNSGERKHWEEMFALQRENLKDSQGAIETLKEAVTAHAWEMDDAAFLYFRMVEIFENDLKDREGAVGILRKIEELFPETRHFANAKHKLREMGEA